MIDIRKAVAADIEGLVASSSGLFAEDAGTRDPTPSQDWPRLHAADSFRAQLDDESKLILMADVDGSVVGHLTGSLGEASDIRPIRVATLVSMYVMPSHRGAGVGAELVAAFRQWAASVGADRRSAPTRSMTGRSAFTSGRVSCRALCCWSGRPNHDVMNSAMWLS